MKTWSEPELKELSVKSTEYWALSGKTCDGHYVSNDGVYDIYTYSEQHCHQQP